MATKSNMKPLLLNWRLLLTLLWVSGLFGVPAPAFAGAAGENPLLSDGFNEPNGSNNLITNEYAAWHPTESGIVDSSKWRSDGGSLFSMPVDGRQAAYTGKLDSNSADKHSESATHSNKMRFWTKDEGFENVRVEAEVKATAWDPAAPSTWGGFKFYLRRQAGATDADFYTAEPYINDGSVYVQKKCGDTYHVLGKKSGYQVPLDSWTKVAATSTTNSDGSVTVGVYRDDELLLSVTDTGTGCAPLTGGRVGWRSDYLQYYLDDFRVMDLVGPSPSSECSDGRDNDSDSRADYPLDPGCSAADDDTESPDTATVCWDGLDNDADGATDFPADGDCSAASDTSEGIPPQCADGEDNDSDGKIDNPDDPGCAERSDYSEAPDPDTTAPATSTITGPSGTVRSSSARFGFRSSEPGSTFECRLDGGSWSACTPPKDYSGLSQGSHTLEVVATDSAGNRDGTPARRIWTIDTVAPKVTGVSPSSGATEIPPTANFFATFSEAMRRSTVTRTTVKLVGKGATTPVAATVSYDSTRKRAKFDPTKSLRRGATYTAKVTTGATDLAGNPLRRTKTWSFTVRR